MSALSKLPQHIRIPQGSTELQQAQRLFHGRGHAYDNLNHITIDWFSPVILITLFQPESNDDIESLADYLLSVIPSCRSIQLQHRYKLTGPVSIIRGENIQSLVIQEDHSQFQLSLGQNRNTGLFLDMRNGRRWVQSNSKNKRVLNLFSYTCAFSITALSGQAKSVLNVDMSSSALQIGRKNHQLNKHDLTNISFEKLNIFKSFGRLKKRGPFDLLICDPPSFQKGSIDIIRDYPKIMRRLDDFMSIDCELLLCLNSPDLDNDFILDHMQNLAPSYRFIGQIQPPSIFVETQGKGLKTLYFKRHQS